MHFHFSISVQLVRVTFVAIMLKIYNIIPNFNNYMPMFSKLKHKYVLY